MEDLQTNNTIVPTARRDGDTLYAAVQGEIDLHSSPDLRSALLELVTNNKPKKLVLNLSKVAYMDSSAVAVLVEALQRMRKVGGKVYLAALQPRVKSLLQIARLDTIFIVINNESEASNA